MEQSLKEAFAAYRLDGADAKLLRHNENATYHVSRRGREYVLRIHAPRPGFVLEMFGVDRHGRGKLEGELAMLRALAEGGLPVQRPVENRMGEGVTVLESGDCATLLTWLEGENVSEVTEEIARDAGRLAARLHACLAALGGLDRYRYDEALLERLRLLLAEGDADGAFGGGMPDILAALDAIRSHMAALRARGNAFGLIHADFSKGNLIETPSGLAPIDFCLSGYGFYAQDLGGMAADFGDKWKNAITRGYSDAEGISVTEKSVDMFVALGVLLFLGSHWRGVMGEDWFPDALLRWRRTLFKPLSVL